MKLFEKGDRVFDIRYGWGIVGDKYNDEFFDVKFEKPCNALSFSRKTASKILSYTEYTLDGHSLEKPKPTWKSIYSEWSYDDSDLKYREFLEQNFEPPVRKCK